MFHNKKKIVNLTSFEYSIVRLGPNTLTSKFQLSYHNYFVVNYGSPNNWHQSFYSNMEFNTTHIVN